MRRCRSADGTTAGSAAPPVHARDDRRELAGASDLGEHACSHRRRSRFRHGSAETRCGRGELGDLLAAGGALLEVRVEGTPLVVGQGVGRVGTGQGVRPRARSCLHPHAVAKPDEPVPQAGLDGAEGHVEQLADLAVGVAAVVGQGDRLALQLGQVARGSGGPAPARGGSRPARPPRRRPACGRDGRPVPRGRGPPARCGPGRWPAGAPSSGSRWRRCPWSGSKRVAVRHTSTSTSWATSSDCAGSRSTRRITPNTTSANWS